MARRSTIRASDADRESVVECLREAAGEGRLAAHELEQRLMTALKAQTYGELDATVSDLPGPQRERRRTAGGRALSTVRTHPALILVAIPVAAIVAAVLVVMAVMWAMVVVIALMLGHHRRLQHLHMRRLQATARHRHPTRSYTPWV